MARRLDVYLNQDFVGRLIQNDDGQMRFAYAHAWLVNPLASPLSYSLPLREEPFAQRACRGFFGGLLPEEEIRTIIARILGISGRNDFAMLEQIGGECAGAITFLQEGQKAPTDDNRYRIIGSDELAKILRELPRRPLMAGEAGVRLSLAGAQHKIAVRIEGANVSIPLGNAPSSHILKPTSATYEGVVANEAFCMALAAEVGLETAATASARIEDIDYLVVERYDRYQDEDGQIRRMHQEDFCQAHGILATRKYQGEGGPSLTDCFSLLRSTSSTPVTDITALLDAVLFNLIIGNHDAHAKNFSLLYLPDGSVRLAPLYDLISTVYYPELTHRMAMKLGGEAKSDRVMPEHIARFARDTGLAVPPTQIRASTMATKILEAIPAVDKPDEVTEKVAALISDRVVKFVARFR